MFERIEYLHIDEDLTVDLGRELVSQSVEPRPGYGHFTPVLTSPCGSDIPGRNFHKPRWFYAPDGRFHQILRDGDAISYNVARNWQSGYELPFEEMAELLLHTMHHEGLLVARRVTPDGQQKSVKIGAILPQINDEEIVGAEYGVLEWDPNDLEPGDLVVAHGSWRCPQHRKINPETGFADSCHRRRDNGHTGKAVCGHGELIGLTTQTEKGLSYPLSMMSRVPDELVRWALKDPEKRLPVVEQVEMDGCVLEALCPSVMAVESPKVILILGDGRAAAAIAFFATHMWPEADIYFTGKTPRKMRAIENINPDKIHGIPVEPTEGNWYGEREVEKTLGEREADLVVPTFALETLHGFKRSVNPDGRVDIWPACHTHPDEHHRYTSVGDPNKLHLSYGGKFGFESVALVWLEMIQKHYPERLAALAEFPFQIVPFEEAAEPIDVLTRTGIFPVVMDEGTTYERQTSGNIIINHGYKEILGL